MPLISIIVPCYNQSQYLDECLQSVLHQTFTDWECIIVNDGSPDNTEEVAAKWVEKDARFHYYKKENGGVASARNFGIERAKGEWILPLDGDDKIGKQYLELASKEFNQGYTLIYCKAELFGIVNQPLTPPPYDKKEILYKNSIFASGFFPKLFWKKAGGYDIKMKAGYEDWEFWINIIYNAEANPICINYKGFYYRRKEESRDTLINNDIEKVSTAKQYIVEKHSKHYVDSMDTIQHLFYLASTREKITNEINSLFYNNIIGRVLWHLAKLNAKIFKKPLK